MLAVSAVPVLHRRARLLSILVLAVTAVTAAPLASAAPNSSRPRDFVDLPAATVFVAYTKGHPEPWTEQTRLWRTDGTAAGTFELRLCSSVCNLRPQIVASSGEMAFVTAYDEIGQWHMWSTDGTQAGTIRLSNFQSYSQVPPWYDMVWSEDLRELYFGVSEGATRTLWASDGTVDGTRRVIAFPAAVHRTLFGPVEHDGAVYFLISPTEPNRGTYELWRSSGTAASTMLVDLVEGTIFPWFVRTSLPGGLIFNVGDDLWRTDGTPSGTGPLATFEGKLQVLRLVRSGDLAWFWAYDATGRQLWRTDGTEAGTLRLTSIAPPAGNPVNGIWDPVPWQDGVVFGVSPGPGHDLELWASDGTPEGTRLLLDLCPGPCPTDLVVANAAGDHIFFMADGHPWESDGSLGGTRKLADVIVSSESLTVPPFLLVGDHLFFRGKSSEDEFAELWAVERATGVVRQLTDFGFFPPSVEWEGGTVGGDRLLFAANDGLHGLEPWVSDGTPEGTRMIADIAPGGDGFASCSQSDRVLCLQGNRFRVEVKWYDQHNGGSGVGKALPASGSDLSGYFWFFTPDNVELIVKVLDGTSINDFFWTFYGALTDVEYKLTVTDTVTGEHRTYHNPPGEICGRGDTSSLPGASATAGNRAASAARQRALSLPATDGSRTIDGVFAAAHPAATCIADAATLCLLDGRFRVRVDWQDQHNGGSGSGGALPFTEAGPAARDVSGFFWFFTPGNIELVVKALDARVLDGNFWFFYGALSDVGYTITVEDLVDGHRAREYVNQPGEICGEGDTSAFSG